MAKRVIKKFNDVEFVQFGSNPLFEHQKREAEQRHREGERLRLRPGRNGSLTAFIHPDDLAANPL